MRKGKFLAIIVLLASIMVLLAYIVSRLDSPIATIFEPTSPTTTPTTTTATTVDEEALKRAKEEERRKLEQHIRDNTIYIAEGARIFKDTELSEEILIAEDKMSLYSLGLKDGFYEVKKDYYDTEVLGYISESFVHLSPMDFIELPEEDCEYEHVRSIPNFQENPRIKVRGVYVTIPTFLGSEYKNIVELINSTDLNAIVVDIKDDSEQLLFTSDSASEYNPAANKLANADKKRYRTAHKTCKRQRNLPHSTNSHFQIAYLLKRKSRRNNNLRWYKHAFYRRRHTPLDISNGQKSLGIQHRSCRRGNRSRI